MRQIILFFILVSIVSSYDPHSCYYFGTKNVNEAKLLGYCPCKYGYSGATCSEIHDCTIGDLIDTKCADVDNLDKDLKWRCELIGKQTVKICNCPSGFTGETCDTLVQPTIKNIYLAIRSAMRIFRVDKEDNNSQTLSSSIYQILLKIVYIISIIVIFLSLRWIFSICNKPRIIYSPFSYMSQIRRPRINREYDCLTTSTTFEKMLPDLLEENRSCDSPNEEKPGIIVNNESEIQEVQTDFTILYHAPSIHI